jgi:UDP-N-acetyl-D-glucosamine dehydrogenase
MPEFVVEKAANILNNFKKPLNGSKVFLLGAAYKKDIDDLRESPVLKVIEHLEKKNAVVMYNDPFIPEFKHAGKHYKSVEITKETLEEADIVIITTDHSAYDYDFIVKHAKVVFDTRNGAKDVKENREKIYKL